jgi:hypothetical protein
MARQRDWPQSRGEVETAATLALRRLLESRTIREVAEVAGVHETAAGRWLYGARPKEPAARALAVRWPETITASVLASWGY